MGNIFGQMAKYMKGNLLMMIVMVMEFCITLTERSLMVNGKQVRSMVLASIYILMEVNLLLYIKMDVRSLKVSLLIMTKMIQKNL